MPSFVPIVGCSYSLVCPSCFSTLNFRCEGLEIENVTCEICNSIISLETLQLVNDATQKNDNRKKENDSAQPVRYSSEIEVNVGCTNGSTFGVDQVFATLNETKNTHSLPKNMTPEVTSAVADERIMAIHQLCWPVFFITYILEFLLFGKSKPYCVLGRVRIYRKKIPFLGYCFIPAPKTTTSYSTLASVIFFFYVCASFSVYRCEDNRLHQLLQFLKIMASILYFNLFRLAYYDPGFLLPAYITGDENGESQSLGSFSANRNLKEQNTSVISQLNTIDKNTREEKWVMVDGVPILRKWCSVCGFYRPVRAAHCYQCGLCVSTHDHHCVVTGSCVGSRNIVYFTFFVTHGTITAGLAGLVTFQCLYYHPNMFSTRLYWFLFFFNVTFCWILTTLATFLTVSLWINLLTATTTREKLTGVYQSKQNPFRRRWYQNLYYYMMKNRKSPTIFRDEIMSAVASVDPDNRRFIV